MCSATSTAPCRTSASVARCATLEGQRRVSPTSTASAVRVVVDDRHAALAEQRAQALATDDQAAPQRSSSPPNANMLLQWHVPAHRRPTEPARGADRQLCADRGERRRVPAHLAATIEPRRGPRIPRCRSTCASSSAATPSSGCKGSPRRYAASRPTTCSCCAGDTGPPSRRC